jgi:AbrB family looped-hinge helix DNA binding protein
MQTTIDGAGRIVVPKAMREALGLTPGTPVDVSLYGNGLAIVPHGRAARLVEEHGHLVATSDRTVTDDELFALIDATRR